MAYDLHNFFYVSRLFNTQTLRIHHIEGGLVDFLKVILSVVAVNRDLDITRNMEHA